MITDSLKLSIYSGERDRAEGAFLGDRLLALFGEHQVEMSILLRGVAGFGLKHHLRTDRLLSLSEDLPLVAIAVDARERIEALAQAADDIVPSGLITLERARMLTEEIEPVALPEGPQDATKLTVYLGRQERVYGQPAFVAVCDLLYRRRIAGATVLLGVDGTAHGERQRARFLARNADVPLMVIAVGSGPEIARVLPELGGLVHRPLMTLERVRVCKRDGQLLAQPEDVPDTDASGLGLWKKLMVFSSEQARVGNKTQHVALVERLRAEGARGATTLRGVWGFHGDHAPHGDRLLQLRRHVPVVTIIVDRPTDLARSFAVVDGLTNDRGLVTSEIVPALAATAGTTRRGGLRLSRP